MFAGFCFFVLPSGVGKGRLDLFRRRIITNRGKSFDDFRLFLDDVKPPDSKGEDDRFGSSGDCVGSGSDRVGSGRDCVGSGGDPIGSDGNGVGCNRVVVVEDSLSYEIVAKILKLNPALRPSDFRVVGTKWLSESLRENRPMELENYEIKGVPPPLFSLSSAPPAAPLVPRREIVDPSTLTLQQCSADCRARDDDDDEYHNGAPSSKIPKFNDGVDFKKDLSLRHSGSAGGSASIGDAIKGGKFGSIVNSNKLEIGIEGPSGGSTLGRQDGEGSSEKKSEGSSQLPAGSWLCSQPSADQNKAEESKNAFVITHLEQLCQVYKTTNDQWRQLSYRKAISGVSLA